MNIMKERSMNKKSNEFTEAGIRDGIKRKEGDSCAYAGL